MKRLQIKFFFICLFLPLLLTAQQKDDGGSSLSTILKISSIKTNDRADTLSVDFKLMKEGKKLFDVSLLKRDPKETFIVSEKGTQEKYWPLVDTIIDIRQQKSMGDNLSVMLLIDRSSTISDNLLYAQLSVVKSFIKAMPDTRLYMSFMNDGTVTPTERVDSTSFELGQSRSFDPEEKHGEKNLYRSILSKLEELSGKDQTFYPEVRTLSEFQDDEGEKIMFVFTDGMVKNERGEYYGGNLDYAYCRNEYFRREQAILNGSEKNIPIFCVYIGENEILDDNLADELAALCSTGSENDLKGKFYTTITPDSLQSLMMGTLDSIAADYRLILINPEGKLYDGTLLDLQIELLGKDGNAYAGGSRSYSLGSVVSPLTVHYKDVSAGRIVLVGLLLGLLLLALTYGIMQFLVPLMRYKAFRKKYVVPYHPSADVAQQTCYYCKEKLQNGELVVTKCQHVVHIECWEENHDRCPEYGRHKCKDGIHYYNKVNKADPKNATHYLSWILAGFLSGLIGWIVFKIFSMMGMFSGMMGNLTEALYPWTGDIDPMVIVAMATKTSQWLQIGLSLGFFMVLAFSYVIEFRKLDVAVAARLLLRAAVGSVLGCLAFFLGSLIVIAAGKQGTCIWLDWIAWLFFALTISTVIWFRSEIKISSALIGGAISVLFSFLVMNVFTGNYTPVFGYMIYAAGLGCAIAVVHYASEKYFLRVDGTIKERDIAIYKWMSVTGGFNHVTIGKSTNCVLHMNWVQDEPISDRAVELYIENDRPFLKVLDNGVTQNGRTMPKGTTIHLVHGTEFNIGKTHFTYLEKDV